nr:MAG TPA: hypothetical protein [Caudoviricetes sp.]
MNTNGSIIIKNGVPQREVLLLFEVRNHILTVSFTNSDKFHLLFSFLRASLAVELETMHLLVEDEDIFIALLEVNPLVLTASRRRIEASSRVADRGNNSVRINQQHVDLLGRNALLPTLGEIVGSLHQFRRDFLDNNVVDGVDITSNTASEIGNADLAVDGASIANQLGDRRGNIQDSASRSDAMFGLIDKHIVDGVQNVVNAQRGRDRRLAQPLPVGVQLADAVGVHFRELLFVVVDRNNVVQREDCIGLVDVLLVNKSFPATLARESLRFPIVLMVTRDEASRIAVGINATSNTDMRDLDGLAVHPLVASIVRGSIQTTVMQSIRICLIEHLGIFSAVVNSSSHCFFTPYSLSKPRTRLMNRPDSGFCFGLETCPPLSP